MLGPSLPRLPVSTTPVTPPPHPPSHFALPCIFFLPFLSCYSSVRTGRVRSLSTKPVIGVLNYSSENTEFGSNYRQDCLQKPQLKIERLKIGPLKTLNHVNARLISFSNDVHAVFSHEKRDTSGCIRSLCDQFE